MIKLRDRSFLRAFCAAWAVAWSSPVFYLVHAGYPFFSVIVLGLALAVVPLGLLAGLMASLGRIGRTVSAYLIAAMAVVLHNQWENEAVATLLYLAAAAFGIIVYFKGDKPVGFLAVIFFVIGLLSPMQARPFFKPAPPPAPTSDRPPLIHIILDEHGPGGFEGFGHWPNAYARHFHTINSLKDMMEGYPRKLERLGYDVEVWHVDYPSFCLDRCALYDPASFENIDEMPLSEQARVMVEMYLSSRQSLRDLPRFPSRTSPMNGKEAFRLFALRTAKMQRGEAIVFHAMLPHGPWAYDADCNLKPHSEWGYRKRKPAHLRQPRYEEQRACTEKLVRAAIREDAIVILHGDHSNRIVRSDPRADRTDLTDDEIIHAFGTLFAVRFPDDSARGRYDQVSVASLLRDFSGSADLRGEKETIWLEDDDWNPVREVEMPSIGRGGDTQVED